MAKSKTVRLSEEELLLIQQIRENKLQGIAEEAPEAKEKRAVISESQQALADAFVSAIERTKDPAKKTVANRKSQTPWSPPLGTPRSKFKRKTYQHGILIQDRVTNEEIDLLNQIRPGSYCDGNVRVTLRKDRGIDITYPVRTASQRLKLVNQYGIVGFTGLLKRVIAEKNEPSKYRKPEDTDLYDLD